MIQLQLSHDRIDISICTVSVTIFDSLPVMDKEAGEILGSARRVVEPDIRHGDVHVSVDGDHSPRHVRLIPDW